MKTVDEIEKIAWKCERKEVMEANVQLHKQSVKDAETIEMLVSFIEGIQYLVAAMPTFMRYVEKILHYSEESEKLEKFLRKYRE